MKKDGSGRRRLTSTPVINTQLGIAFRPRWSPDGETLAVTIVTEHDPGSTSFWLRVATVSVEDGALRPISPAVEDPDLLGALLSTWSPNGSEIAFVSDAGGDFEVYVSRLARKQVRNITKNSLNEYEAVWSP